jgi:hypothetical protein
LPPYADDMQRSKSLSEEAVFADGGMNQLR